MKAIFTFILVLFIGMTVCAQEVNPEVKVVTVTKGMMIGNSSKASLENDHSVARLYLFKNSRIKKELSFDTKRNKSKLT